MNFKMNKIINICLLTGDTFMPELHFQQPGFIYSASGPFTKHHEGIWKFREEGNLKYLNRNELGKACFAHDAAYSDSKDLAKGTIWDKILNDKAYEIARNRKYDWFKKELASVVYRVVDKKTGSGVSVNEQLAGELFKRIKVYERFKDYICAADIAEMGYSLLRTKTLNIYYV